ncbi:TIGR02757 family protein [bacterium]|nr:TIGR02757 family protein [bacterium]
MITKGELDKLAEKYENENFIKEDPVQFIHMWKTKEDIELAGFIASLFAYGNRKIFISKLNNLFFRSGNDLSGYIKNGDFNNLKGFEYRFSKDFDIIPVFDILHILYAETKGLEELFNYNFLEDRGEDYDHFLNGVVEYFYARAPKNAGHGFYHMIPNPQNGGAMKRMNMFLRWMVRKSPVDAGIWDFMKPKDLYIPLDVHVARLSRQMGLLTRKSNDYRAVKELMENLKKFSPDDPVKYDFAMFAFGVELNKEKMEQKND